MCWCIKHLHIRVCKLTCFYAFVWCLEHVSPFITAVRQNIKGTCGFGWGARELFSIFFAIILRATYFAHIPSAVSRTPLSVESVKFVAKTTETQKFTM